MSGREWQPGDVAAATYCGDPNVRVSRYGHGWARLTNPDDFINDADRNNNGDHLVTDVRALVVIDPESREQVERLWRIWTTLAPDHRLAQDNMQAALREFANPTPPKPEEPTGLGAVVEDAEGLRWVRVDGDDYPWFAPDSRDFSAYKGLSVVRVLSEGVS